MWELRKRFPLGRLSMRTNIIFATMVIVASFVLTLLTGSTALAADATWQGSSISYGSNQFIKADPKAMPGLPSSISSSPAVYIYTEPATSSPSTPTKKAHLIYFASGTDPTTATSATYVTFDFTPPDTYANGSSATAISIDAQAATSKGVTSCALEGIGWIVCPVSNFLASAMDWMFEILSNFLTVRPVQTSQDNALFRMWSVMRNFANVVFVIVFLIVIYSQVTNIGLSNYGIKRILPRLVLVAIMVNISYWVYAIGIDLSNISGHSIQQLFINLRNTVVGGEGNSWEISSWQSVTSFILSGGTAAVLTGIGVNMLLGSAISGAVYMLIPILVIVLTSVLVALLVMALRQALITILVIISALTFVAYLLPNTEKYGQKANGLFLTMLTMFPVLSLIFGGAQLAGTAIIQNANSINLILLGMAVQVAPVIVTPLLVRFSGTLLTRVAGMVNNPNKGLIDRTRNWARERADEQKARVLGNPAAAGWRGATARRTQNIDAKRRKREGWKKANESFADARWANDHQSHQIHEAMERASMQKETGEAIGQAAVNRLKTTNGSRIQIDDVNLRIAKIDADMTKTGADVQFENMRAKESALNQTPSHLASQARYARQQALGSAVLAQQLGNAQHVQQQNLADAFQADPAMREAAGGIAPDGAKAAFASAISATRKAWGERTDNSEQLLKHFNPSGELRQKLAMGVDDISIKDAAGKVIYTFNKGDVHAREAAIEMQLGGAGSFKDIEQIVMSSGGELDQYKTTIKDAVAKNKLAEKAAYLGGKNIDKIGQGLIKNEGDLNKAVANTIGAGKIRAEQLATMDLDAVIRIFKVATSGNLVGVDEKDLAKYPERLAALGANAQKALKNPSLSGRVADNVREELEKMVAAWPPPPDSNN